MRAIEELSGRLNSQVSRLWGEVKRGYTRFEECDVVMAKITPSMENGKVAIAANLLNGVAAGTTELHVLRPRGDVDGRYIMHYLLQESVRRRARARMTGTAGQLRVPTAFLEEEELPVAPEAEQARICESIESQARSLIRKAKHRAEAQMEIVWTS
jgi:type I restriction enzyme S subunit